MPDFSKPLVRLISIVLALAVVGVFFQVRSCSADRQRAAEVSLHKGQQGALANSTADAVNTQGAANQRERASEDLSRTNEREIRDAEGANDSVNPAVRDAGLRALCRREANRHAERCRVFRTPAA